MIQGRITEVSDEGTIVVVNVTAEDGMHESVVFDHRMFQHLWDDRGGQLIGSRVSVEDGMVYFEDDAEEP